MKTVLDLQNNIKFTNSHIRRVPEEERKKVEQNIFKDIQAENVSNPGKVTDNQVQKPQRVTNRINPKTITPRHTVIKMAKIKDKERILKAAREKQQVMYKGTPIRLLAKFSAETLKARGNGMIYM